MIAGTCIQTCSRAAEVEAVLRALLWPSWVEGGPMGSRKQTEASQSWEEENDGILGQEWRGLGMEMG